MTALVVGLESIVDHVLLAHLHVIRDPGAIHRFSPAAFVQGELSVDQLALFLEQPVHAVVRATAFLIGRERDDEVAIGLESFTLVADQIRDPHRRLRLVVARSPAVEVAVLLGERERIHAPVVALRLHDVGVREEEDRTAAPGAVVANDEVRFIGTRAADEDVRVGKAGRFEAPSDGLGHGCRRAGRVPRLDLDHLLVDGSRQLAVALGRHGPILGTGYCGEKKGAQNDTLHHEGVLLIVEIR